MQDTLNEQLVRYNNELLNRIVELQRLVETAQTCESEAACPLCSTDKPCSPHAQIRQLSAKPVAARLRRAELEIDRLSVEVEALRVSEEEARNQLSELSARVPVMVEEARLGAAPMLAEMRERTIEHEAFMHRIAEKLGIVHEGVSLNRVQLMVNDAIRKLVG
jgi:hypothetical protein